MCVANFSVPMGPAKVMRDYPAAKKRRNSYAEESDVFDQSTVTSCSTVLSDDSAETSCSYDVPDTNTRLHPQTSYKSAEPIALLHAVMPMQPQPVAGWFSKCRGCGCKTAHEMQAPECVIPLCVRCQQKVNSLQGDSHGAMVANLCYVHQCWEQLGL